jgi:hypothetical protein
MLLFEGLWCLADREGRLEDRPKRIKAEIFPYFDPKPNVETLLCNLQEAGFIKRYSAGGNYIQIINFLKHQNPHYLESPSQIPPPDGHVDSLYIAPALTKAQRKKLLEKLGRKCAECGARTKLQIDHIVPRSRRGTNDEGNLQILCASCNARKRNKLMAEARRTDVHLTSGGHQLDVSVVSPSDSLIPDSLNPDSTPLVPSPSGEVVGGNATDPTPSPPVLENEGEDSNNGHGAKQGLTPNALAQLWNQVADPVFPRVLLPMSERRARKLRPAIRDKPEVEWWRALFLKAGGIPFLRGDNDRGWRADLEFVVRRREEILEGKYDHLIKPKSEPKWLQLISPDGSREP